MRTYTADGDEVIMSLPGQGDVFGEMAALDGASRSADVVALTPLHLIKLHSVPFVALLGQQASFALALARLEASRLRISISALRCRALMPPRACLTPWRTSPAKVLRAESSGGDSPPPNGNCFVGWIGAGNSVPHA